jgi:DivIVA domain-containing protein
MTVTFGEPRLTPDRVQSITFPTARLGRRGFDEERVREFCAQVKQELVALLNEKAALWEEVERLRKRILAGAQDTPGCQPEDAHVQAVRVLSKAQETADRYVADAQHYSRQLAEDARRRRDELLAEAQADAERLLEQAHQHGREAAKEALAGHTGSPSANGDRAGLQAELAYLRTFSDVYRTHLRAYLEALLRNVEEWEQAEKASLTSAKAGLPVVPVP